MGSHKKRERKGLKIYLMELELKTLKPEEENRYPGTGSTKGAKKDEPKETHTKTLYIK